MLDYRMETFLTLCKTMNYRKTAELLNITQPAVTQHIKYLEEYYGCRLFTYEKRKLTMTEQADVLLRYVYSQNYQEQKLVEAIKQKPAYHLSIGTTKTIGTYVIAEQAKRFLREPKNCLSIETDNTTRILSLLDEGKIDFALIEGYFDASRYQSRRYRMEPFVGLCSVHHPFANRIVTLEEALHETVIIREEGSGTRSILERMLQVENHALADFERMVSIGNFGLLEQLVADGAGITFAFQVVGSHNPLIAEFHIEGFKIEREFRYVYLPDTQAEEYVALFDRYR